MLLSDLFQLHGSIVLRSVPAALIAATLNYFILHWGLLYRLQAGDMNANVPHDTSIMLHPGPFAFFLQGVALILALFGTVAYQRFWEARSAVATFGAAYYSAAAQLLAFDEPLPTDIEGEATDNARADCPASMRPNEHLWLAVPPLAVKPRSAPAAKGSLEFRQRVVTLISLQHAVCIERLLLSGSREGHERSVLDSLSVISAVPADLAALRDALNSRSDAKSRSFLVNYWLQQVAIRRHMMFPGSTLVNGSIAARAYGLLESGFAAYCQACKVDEASIPATLTQLMCLTALLVLIVGPITVALWVPVEGFSILFSFIVVFSFEALGQAAFAVAAPFKQKLIPLRKLHKSFNERLRMLADASESGSALDSRPCNHTMPSNLTSYGQLGGFYNTVSAAVFKGGARQQLLPGAPCSNDANASDDTLSDVESPSERSSGGRMRLPPVEGPKPCPGGGAAPPPPWKRTPRSVKPSLQSFPSPRRTCTTTTADSSLHAAPQDAPQKVAPLPRGNGTGFPR